MRTSSFRNSTEGQRRTGARPFWGKLLAFLAAAFTLQVSATFCEKYPPEQCAAVRDGAAALSWTAENVEKLRRLFSSRDQVEQFLCTFVYPYEEDSVRYEVVSQANTGLAFRDEEGETYPEDFISVSSYDFFDLHGDGKVELFAIAENGKAEFIIIVDQVGNRFVQQKLVNERGEFPTLESRFYRPEGTSGSCILANEILDHPPDWCYVDPLPVFPHVYEWNGKEWVEADAKHKDYYAKVVLPPLEAELAAGPCPDEEDSVRAKCRYSLQKEIGAVKALLAAP